LSGIGEEVRSIVSNAGASIEVLERVGIMTLDVAHKGESDAARGVLILRMILEDPGHAETAWDLLVRESEVMCRDRRRFTFDKLAHCCSERNEVKEATTVGEGAPLSANPSSSFVKSRVYLG